MTVSLTDTFDRPSSGGRLLQSCRQFRLNPKWNPEFMPKFHAHPLEKESLSSRNRHFISRTNSGEVAK